MYWDSTVSLDDVFSGTTSLSFPSLVGSNIFYLSQLPDEQGRTVVMRYNRGDKPQRVSPDNFSVNTVQNGYGGRCYWANNKQLFFVNADDQHIYRTGLAQVSQDQTDDTIRITPKQLDASTALYSSFRHISEQHALAVVEFADSDTSAGEGSRSAIVSIELNDNSLPLNSLIESTDFYSNLVINGDANKVAWVSWDKHNMPWNNTRLWIADLTNNEAGLSVSNITELCVDKPGCYCQLVFSADNKLFFAADFENAKSITEDFWNIYCIEAFDVKKIEAKNVTELALEFGAPHWQYDDNRIVVLDNEHLLAAGMGRENTSLYIINTLTLKAVCVSDREHTLSMLNSDNKGTVSMLYATPSTAFTIAQYNARTGLIQIKPTPPTPPNRLNTSVGRHIEYTVDKSEKAYGYYYPPKNASYQLTQAPPLIVIVHGGPTSRAYSYFDIQKQFWTTRGFAIFDVNHRGSTGYGRYFRDSLLGHWGLKDIRDIKAGVEYLVAEGLANRQQLFIRGKSAGGYAVMRVLTELPELFKAGASYYGIGNLSTLSALTHRFEKYYVDSLIGEKYSQTTACSRDSNYYKRSPINYVDRLASPMILFQGAKDKVVPPKVSKEIVHALKRKHIDCNYREFANEGHGFKDSQSNKQAYAEELAFYSDVIEQSNTSLLTK